MDLQAQDLNKLKFAPDAARTLAESAANRLREAILLGRLLPGTRLSQESLARQLGVSRVPLREALRALAAEGLVEWRAHQSAIVTGLSANDLLELYRLGAVTEAAAAEQACLVATPQHVEKLSELLDSMARPGISPVDWSEANRRFHAMLAEPAGWPRFLRIISEVRANTGRYVEAYLEMSGNIHRWHDEHLRIFEAFRKRKRSKVGKAVLEHWLHTSETLLNHLRTNSSASSGPTLKD
jgi:DNA-binding GntR family transcriptional regulator